MRPPADASLRSRPSRLLDVWRCANLADRLYLAYFIVVGGLILLLRHRVAGWPAFVQLHLLVIAVIVSLIALARRFPTAHAWYPLLMPLLVFQEVAQLNFLFVDGWRDHHLLAFEAWLFPEPPTAWLGRVVGPLAGEMLQIGYLSYFLLLTLIAGLLYRRVDQAPFEGVMAATVLAYLLCYVLFVTFPTEGPAHTLRHLHTVPLGGGPFHRLVRFVQQAGVHGNAFPSAHVAGAMVPLVFGWRYLPTTALGLTPLVALMCIGAVYDRYHYASDVLAGLAIGAAAAWCVMDVQRRPRWARRLNILPGERGTDGDPVRVVRRFV